MSKMKPKKMVLKEKYKFSIRTNNKLMRELQDKNQTNGSKKGSVGFQTVLRWVNNSDLKLSMHHNVALICNALELPSNEVFEFVSV